MNNIKELLEGDGVVTFKAGNQHGGEYHSSCPGCGDGSPRTRDQGRSDRFQIWPAKQDGMVYVCRRCGKHGDCIQYLIDFHGKGYREACAELGIDPGSKTKTGYGYRGVKTPTPPQAVPAPVFAPHTPAMPSEAWMTKAAAFADWCHQQLLDSEDGQAMLASRGLTLNTARRYRIGYNPGEKGHDLHRSRQAWGLSEIKTDSGRAKSLWLPRGLVMPLFAEDGRVIQLRVRRRPEDIAAYLTGLSYQLIEGSCHATMVLEPTAQAFVVVESGLDAYLVAQEALGLAGAVTTWNAQAKPDARAHAVLDKAMCLLVALDNDDPGAKASRWWLSQFENARRWPTPNSKDPGDAKRAGLDLGQWILAGLPPALTIGVVPNLAGEDGGRQDIPEEAGGKVAAEPTAPAVVTSPEASAADDIAELAGLLAAHPLRILKSKDNSEVRIQWTPAWTQAHQAEADRLSNLIFHSAQVGRAIDLHPAQVIHGRNFLSGIEHHAS